MAPSSRGYVPVFWCQSRPTENRNTSRGQLAASGRHDREVPHLSGHGNGGPPRPAYESSCRKLPGVDDGGCVRIGGGRVAGAQQRPADDRADGEDPGGPPEGGGVAVDRRVGLVDRGRRLADEVGGERG